MFERRRGSTDVPGAVVQEADLELTGDGFAFEEIELLE
jgi:hypothetical protein